MAGGGLTFRRAARTPLLGLEAVPWCAEEVRPRPSIIFPTVVDTAAFGGALHEPLDRFYMYYAPHHSDGMGLATAPHPEGPWTPYPGNPILRMGDAPGLRSHISSPEIVFRPDQPAAPLWLYFHGRALQEGGGQETCVAESADGIGWRLLSREPVLRTTPEESGEGVTAAYARVFKRGEWFYALYKGGRTHGLARARDGLKWEHRPGNPLLRAEPEEGECQLIRHTGLLVQGDTLLIFYCSPTLPDLSREEIMLATLDIGADDWREWGSLRRRGVVVAPELDWEAGDLRDPFPLVHKETLYLYYVGGHEQGIGLVSAGAESLPAGR